MDITDNKEDRNPSQIQGLKDVPDLVKKNRLKDAWDILDAHQDEFKDFDFIYVWQAVIFQKNGQTAEAENTLTDGLKLARQKHILCYRMGDLKYQDKDIASAVKWWVKSVEIMYQTQAVTIWEPFLYLAYIAKGCKSEKYYNILMSAVAGIFIHGELQLEQNAQENLNQMLATIPPETPLTALENLCKKINPDTVSDLPQSPLLEKKAENSVPVLRKKKQIYYWLLLILISILCLSGYFVFSKKTGQLIRIEKTPDIIINEPSPDVLPAEKETPASAAAEKPVPEQSSSSEIPPNKKKDPWLKVKTKTANPDIKKKSPAADPISTD